jgi:RNA polymerase sigma-70 factor (ECF subfamily)
VAGRQAYRLVKKALDEAPPLQRSAFLLYRLSGCTYAEIAARLGVSPTSAARYVVAMADRLFLTMAAVID